MDKDIRWEQRFSNFVRAFEKLTQSINFIKKNFNDQFFDDESIDKVLAETIKEGLIQRFEYTHELAWNVLKDFAKYQGNTKITGSRDATREALQLGLISSGDVWMDMIQSRNKTSHTYNEETANEIYVKIINEYYPLFIEFKKLMIEKRDGEQKTLFQ